MYEELDSEDEGKKIRREKTTRLRSPRAARSTRRKKTSTGFGGSHQRRNKHWSW
jgi:hypothetical protein